MANLREGIVAFLHLSEALFEKARGASVGLHWFHWLNRLFLLLFLKLGFPVGVEFFHGRRRLVVPNRTGLTLCARHLN